MSFTVKTRGVGDYRTGETHALVTSKHYVPDGSRAGIIYCHAYDGTADTNIYPVPQDRIAALARAGYPVLSCDLELNSWANDDGLAAIDDAWAFLTGSCGADTTKVGLLGSSMGTLNALAWARANLLDVFAVAGVIPILDLDDIYQTDPGGLRASIETAYGITHPTAIPSLATRSPMDFAGSDLAGLPVKLWTSSNDTVAATTAEAQGWDGAGADVTVVDLGAVGHVGSSAPAVDIVQFFDDSGGRT